MRLDNKKCWLVRIKTIYDAAGLSYKFNLAISDNVDDHVNEITMRLSDQFVQTRFGQLTAPEGKNRGTGNKLRTYRMFKRKFQYKQYLSWVTMNKHRTALTKFRVSCHKLAIETGRYHKPSSLPINERLCLECGSVEDEIHLLCHCKRNATLRVKLFTDVTHRYASFAWLLPNEKLVYLMSSEDPQVLQTTAEFIYNSFLMVI